jgi:hypothetical protein
VAVWRSGRANLVVHRGGVKSEGLGESGSRGRACGDAQCDGDSTDMLRVSYIARQGTSGSYLCAYYAHRVSGADWIGCERGAMGGTANIVGYGENGQEERDRR